MIRKTFKYRLYPSKSQITRLDQTLDACRWAYNHFIEERKTAWEAEKQSLSRYNQTGTLPTLKKENPFLENVYSQVLQNVATRVDLAFRAFFRRVKAGETPGYPRFRGKFRYDSFTYPQAGFEIVNNAVVLSKIGRVKLKLHRPTEGTIKTCNIRRSATGKWFVTFSCIVDHEPVIQPIEPTIGIDMGLESFVTFSTGDKIENPRFFRNEEEALAKVQRKLSRQPRGSKHRAKARKVVARVHERITWKRDNFVHQEARKIVNQFNTVVVEDLNINKMQKDNFHGINKSIGDAAWGQFLETLAFKAEYAGKRVVKINPAFTSQTCSRCGKRHKLELSDRVFHCPHCGLSLNRDWNAAINILTIGLNGLGSGLKSPQL